MTRVDETLNVVEGFDGTNGVLAGDMLQQLPMLKLKCIEEFVEVRHCSSCLSSKRLPHHVLTTWTVPLHVAPPRFHTQAG